MASKPKVGREKDPDVGRILALAPDLVVANIEENRREVVETLRAAGIAVWVAFPRTVAEGIRLVRELGDLTGRAGPAGLLADDLETRYRAVCRDTEARRPVRVFCPIWRDPYMTVSRDTYVHDTLRVAGGENVFGERPERYPQVTLEEVRACEPEVILLPDEPFRFRRAHLPDLAPLAGTPALVSGRVHLMDGKLLSWYGPRIAQALERLPALLTAPGV